MDKDFSPYKTQLNDKSRLIQQQGLQALSNDLETYKSTFIFIKLISFFIRTISIDRTEYMKCISNLFNLLKTTNEQQSLSLIESMSLCFIITISSSQAAKYRKYSQEKALLSKIEKTDNKPALLSMITTFLYNSSKRTEIHELLLDYVSLFCSIPYYNIVIIHLFI